MSLYIDSKYLNMISVRLAKFKRKNDNLWNFRCPFCGDSKKNQNKARGYFYLKGNAAFFKCHNCNRGNSLVNFIKEIDPVMAQEYLKERYFTTEKEAVFSETSIEDSHVSIKPVFNTEKRVMKNAERISELSDEHYAKQYIMNRDIPEARWDDLYFTTDFKEFISQYSEDSAKSIKPETHMIIIPFMNALGELVAVQGRAFSASSRYMTIKFNDDPKIWGLDKIDMNKRVFVLEGPLDAMFVQNAIAMAGADNKYLLSSTDKGLYTFVFDNEPYNREIQQRMYDAVDKGFSIVIWDKKIREKDVNDMVSSGVLHISDITQRLNDMTYSGIRAKLQIMEWRKR